MRPQFPAVALLLGLLCPAPSAAQTVVGRLLHKHVGVPVDGALVLLLAADGEQRGGSLTNEAGRFVIRAPAPGRYSLRAERVGFESVTSEVFDIGEGQTVSLVLESAETALALEGFSVEGARRCVLRPSEGLGLAQLWEEAQKALRNQDWSDRAERRRFYVVRYERDVDPTFRVSTWEGPKVGEWIRGNPIESRDAADLLEGGFIQRGEARSFSYFGPDARVLLSSAFLDTHCFRVATDPADASVVGLSFEPVGRRRVADIAGTLWLERKSAHLRYLEFGYTSSPWIEAEGVANGRVEFERLQDGAWIVRRWWIRMPRMTEDPALMMGGRSGLRVAAIREAGGEVVRMASPETASRAAGAPGGVVTGRVWDSIGAGPMVDATVHLSDHSGEPYTATTDSTGHFTLRSVPQGTYEVAFLHPRLDSLGIHPAAVEARVRGERIVEVELAVPPRGAVMEALCGGGLDPGASVVVGVVRTSRTGDPVAGADVSLEWTDYRAVSSTDLEANVQTLRAVTDERGRYTACGIPPGVLLTARASSQSAKGGVRRIVIGREHLAVLDLTLAVDRESDDASLFCDVEPGDHALRAAVTGVVEGRAAVEVYAGFPYPAP